ncbi:hypothetical protein Tco_0071033 [Tanacetum coccineum]
MEILLLDATLRCGLISNVLVEVVMIPYISLMEAFTSVTKILASRLSLVISDLISDVQTAFLPNRQILDGPFIINEILARCKLKKQQAMIFKVDFARLIDSLAVEAGIFKGYKIDPSTTLSFFYADDAVFIGEWSHSNLKGVMNILRCFSLLSGMLINIQKSHLLGVGIPDNCVAEAAKSTGDRKIAWTNGSKVLALRNSEVGSFSFFASQTGLFFSVGYGATFSDNSLWSRIISALHGLNGHVLSAAFNSTWSSIITEVNSLKVKGVDLISHCKIRVGKGTGTAFGSSWIHMAIIFSSFLFPVCLSEENKDFSVLIR